MNLKNANRSLRERIEGSDSSAWGCGIIRKQKCSPFNQAVGSQSPDKVGSSSPAGRWLARTTWNETWWGVYFPEHCFSGQILLTSQIWHDFDCSIHQKKSSWIILFGLKDAKKSRKLFQAINWLVWRNFIMRCFSYLWDKHD